MLYARNLDNMDRCRVVSYDPHDESKYYKNPPDAERTYTADKQNLAKSLLTNYARKNNLKFSNLAAMGKDQIDRKKRNRLPSQYTYPANVYRSVDKALKNKSQTASSKIT
jgi:hypothetical protein